MTPDSELLAVFARNRSEAEFGELVRRHVNLVYSAALRQVNGDAHLAQDVAQTVFADLARKAKSLAGRGSLTGWLYTSAHFAAAKAVRSEARRRQREEQFMREPLPESAPEAEWEALRPLLDAAMHELKEADREAILLRYFENRPFAEIGAKLGLGENAARMRVDRALEKLRAVLRKRGVATSATLAAVISAHAIQLAPAGLASVLATSSVATATVGAGTLTIIKIMTATQIKLGISAIIVAGMATALVVQHQKQAKLRNENNELSGQLAELRQSVQSMSNQLASAVERQKLPDAQMNELLKLRGEVGTLRAQASEGEKTRKTTTAAKERNQLAQRQFSQQETKINQAMLQAGMALRMFSESSNHQFPTNFFQCVNELGGSFNIGGIDVHDFDFVNAGSVRWDWPRMAVLRERQARQSPDGTWHRIYAMADGQVLVASSASPDFEAWEKENTDVPPPSQ